MAGEKSARASQEISRRETAITDREFSDFLLRLCHDLETPLRAVRAHAELLRKSLGEIPPEGTSQSLTFVGDGVRRMDLLSQGLSGYALALRIDNRGFRPAALDVLLRAALARLEKEVRENQAEVTYDRLPRVAGDPDRLVQLFEHLLSNALRHRGPEAPRIHISAEKREADWLVGVRDNGPGMESGFLERIFNPFERLRGNKMSGPGMGLAICRAIVERHGGRIWAESEPSQGSTFFFTIPAMEEALPAGSEATAR
jgi:light-regulated signal transduction histidine kinase (bacteriophytochrome)